MDLSIIIPIYNVQDYLEQCLTSLIGLDIESYEIIAVNDGSTDKSGDILQEYSNLYPGLIKIYKQENSGQSTARNLGLKMASGKYISFVDSDDYIIPQEFVAFWVAVKDKNLDVAIANYRTEIDGDAKELRFRADSLFSKKKQLLLDSYGVMTGLNYFQKAYDYRKDCINVEVVTQIYNREFLQKNELLFCDGLLHEDTLFSISVYLKAHRIAFFPYTFYIYRMREGSTMHTISYRNYSSIWYIANQLYDQRKTLGKSFKAFDSILANLIYEAAKCDQVIDDKKKMNVMLKNLKKLTLRAFVKKMILLLWN